MLNLRNIRDREDKKQTVHNYNKNTNPQKTL